MIRNSSVTVDHYLSVSFYDTYSILFYQKSNQIINPFLQLIFSSIKILNKQISFDAGFFLFKIWSNLSEKRPCDSFEWCAFSEHQKVLLLNGKGPRARLILYYVAQSPKWKPFLLADLPSNRPQNQTTNISSLILVSQ